MGEKAVGVEVVLGAPSHLFDKATHDGHGARCCMESMAAGGVHGQACEEGWQRLRNESLGASIYDVHKIW